MEASIDRTQGNNVWLTVGLREGKNREVKRLLGYLGLETNRLIRISYGPFQIGDLAPGAVLEIRGRVLRDQLGVKLMKAAGADFEAPVRQPPKPKHLPLKRAAVSDEAEKDARPRAKTPRPGGTERKARGGSRDRKHRADRRR
jgi:23S rRNA pseudouridine2605 synthase